MTFEGESGNYGGTSIGRYELGVKNESNDRLVQFCIEQGLMNENFSNLTQRDFINGNDLDTKHGFKYTTF